jgi:hypothetical protein
MTSTNVAVLPNAAPVLQFEPRAKPLVPQSMDECVRLAQICARSGLLPKSFYDEGKDPVAAAFVAIQLGAEVGLSPMTAVQYVAVVNGRPTLYGPAQLAIVQRSGLLEIFEEGIEFEAGKPADAWCKVKRIGRPEKTTRFTWAQASKAGLTNKKGPWQEYPERMLQARARTFALRDAFPDVLLGLAYSTEEMADAPRVIEAAPEPPKDRPSSARSGEVPSVTADVTPPASPAASPAASPKPPLLVNLPDGWEPAQFPRTGKGLKEALEFLAAAVLDGSPVVVPMNMELLDTIAEKMPALADEVAELRSAAAEALAPKDEPDNFVQEFLGEDDFPGDKPLTDS